LLCIDERGEDPLLGHDEDLLQMKLRSGRLLRFGHVLDHGRSTAASGVIPEHWPSRASSSLDFRPTRKPTSRNWPENCEDPRMAPYSWTVREGSLDGPVVMREYVYEVPDKEPVEGQELYLSDGSGPWRVTLREQVPEVPLSPYNILVVESVY
jgi:hypothetical protein